MTSVSVNSTISPDASPFPDSTLTMGISNPLPFRVLIVVVCVLVVLGLVTSLSTCCYWLVRGRGGKRKGEGGDSGSWAPEESDHSVTSSSYRGEILREDVETDSVNDKAWMRASCHRIALAPSPSIFSQEDFLMEEIGGTKFRPGFTSTVKDERCEDPCPELSGVDIEGEFDIDSFCERELSSSKMPRSASTVALHSLDLDNPVLSSGDTRFDAQGNKCGGGWLLYSIMREIKNSSRNSESMADEVFLSSKEEIAITSKYENCYSSSENDIGVVSKKEVVECSDSDDLSREVFVKVEKVEPHGRKQKHPLEVKVIIQDDLSGC